MPRPDNEPYFILHEDYLKKRGIKWVATTRLWPQANGEVERTIPKGSEDCQVRR